jgi:hypothetical protein
MKLKYLAPIMLMAIAAAFLATPALAQPPGKGPKYAKHVASLELEGVRYGQVIFNTNPEDDGRFELEVEVEECLDLADSTVEVFLSDVMIGTIYIDAYGNGKATFYVEAISIVDTIKVEGAITLTSGEWRLWVKVKGPK